MFLVGYACLTCYTDTDLLMTNATYNTQIADLMRIDCRHMYIYGDPPFVCPGCVCKTGVLSPDRQVCCFVVSQTCMVISVQHLKTTITDTETTRQEYACASLVLSLT